jgi:hypothetical protein
MAVRRRRQTPVATVMTGAQTTLNNQLNAVVATATKTATMTAMMTTMNTEVMAVAAADWQGIGYSVAAVAAAWWQRWRQLGKDDGSSLAKTTATMAWTTTTMVETVTSHLRRRHCTAAARRHSGNKDTGSDSDGKGSGDKDTGSDSNGKGTDNTQQSTKYLTCNILGIFTKYKSLLYPCTIHLPTS